MKKIILLLIIFTGAAMAELKAQDTLPNFSVKDLANNRIIISWFNNYPEVKQISIQRSTDSLKNYKTILTIPDPMNRENGYVDTKAPDTTVFYRLFIMIDGWTYHFSSAKRPFIDSGMARQKKILDPFSVEINRPPTSLDSMTLLNGHDQKNKPNIFVASIFVYTARDGNVHLNLPDVDTKRYGIKFFDEKDSFLFEIKNLKQSSLIVDKTNFYHAGWFKFELYVDDKLKEKNKFYLEKEF